VVAEGIFRLVTITRDCFADTPVGQAYRLSGSRSRPSRSPPPTRPKEFGFAKYRSFAPIVYILMRLRSKATSRIPTFSRQVGVSAKTTIRGLAPRRSWAGANSGTTSN
jgi:hypothetical protein